jgi:hypothetical protein
VIIHPVTQYKNNRPQWLPKDKNLYSIDASKLKNLPVLALAYRKGEFKNNGIPADIIEIKDQQSTNTLFLAPGKYEIIFKDVNYKVINSLDVDIK